MKAKTRFQLVLSLILVLPILAFAVQNVSAAHFAPAISWGLKPNTQGRTPNPPDGSEQLLQRYNGIFVGDTTKQSVYFSFDLGYEAGYTDEVLDILKENQIKAVFFLCGNYLKETELIERMINEGHAIGNHTDRHKDLPTLSDDGIQTDIRAFSDKFYQNYSGVDIRYFRPPQGKFCERTLKIASGENLKTMMWSIAIKDWGKEPIDAEANANRIHSRLHPGAIMLFHITNAGTPKMLRLLIPKIVQQGYQIGASGEL